MIFELHADEILSAEILKPDIRDRLLNDVDIGCAAVMPWINLWKSANLYRDDNSVWSNNKSWFCYKDDRKAKFYGQVFHGPRCPESFIKNKIDIDYLQVIHYQFVNLSMERSKQALYQIFERNNYPDKNIEHINKIYSCAFDERHIKLKLLKGKHVDPWINKGINLKEEYSNNLTNWRDEEVIKNFSKYGVNRYKDLNIWYIDWEDKRKKLLSEGENIAKIGVITDPRSINTKIAHKFLMKYNKYPFWRIGFIALLYSWTLRKIKYFLFSNKK